MASRALLRGHLWQRAVLRLPKASRLQMVQQPERALSSFLRAAGAPARSTARSEAASGPAQRRQFFFKRDVPTTFEYYKQQRTRGGAAGARAEGRQMSEAYESHASAQAASSEAAYSRADGTSAPADNVVTVHIASNAESRTARKHAVLWGLARGVAIVGLVMFLLGTLNEERLSSGGGPGRLGNIMSKDVVHQVQETNTTFADVRGMESEIKELEEIVEYLKNPTKFTSMGAKLPKGVLMVGPPGTGKTLLGRAVAGEADVPFYFASGSEFEEMFVGVGARRMRDLFQAAKKSAPCIIFIDEIDAVGGRRGSHDSVSVRQTINQLLTLMDGFEQNSGVIVMAATNSPDILDAALVRPGRFDKQIVVERPSREAREDIIRLYLSKVPHDEEDIDVPNLARTMIGASGADLANLVNTAALKASMANARVVTQQHLEWALDRLALGNERRDVRTEQEIRLTAFHEGGHALVALLTDGAGPVHKATILPRGQALGVVVQRQTSEVSRTRKELLASLDVCMGGRVAEELIFGKEDVTTGALSDMQKATSIARNLVEKYAMSDWGIEFVDDRTNLSAAQRERLDQEVSKILEESYKRVRASLTRNRAGLDRLASALLEYETLSGDELQMVIKGKDVRAAREKNEAAIAARSAAKEKAAAEKAAKEEAAAEKSASAE